MRASEIGSAEKLNYFADSTMPTLRPFTILKLGTAVTSWLWSTSGLRSYPIDPCVFCKGGLFVTLLRGQFALQFPLAQAVSNLIAASARSRAFAPASVPSIPPVCNSDHKD